MSRLSNLLRGAIGLGAIASIAACGGDLERKLFLPVNPAGGEMVRNYVALGNSITAGWQSDGINDSTQRASYANLFALQAGARFAYPSFTKPGCPVVLGNWVSQKRIDSLTPVPLGCAFRDPSKATDVLNNVAVPFAYASDLTVTGAGIKIPQATVHSLILGGMSQVDRALVAEPTFASVWVGNNETLAPATVGMTTGLASAGAPALVSKDEFIGGLKKALDSLVKVRPNLKGILIGATKVTNTPRFFSADTLQLNATRKTQFETFHGRGSTLIFGCGTTVTGWLISSELPKQIRAGTHPNLVSCIPNVPAAGVGDVFMLSPAEVATFNQATDDYNVYVKAKADTLKWAYLDPNVLLAAQRTGTAPAIPAWPNLTSATRDASTSVFGALFSLDGVHPTAAGQRLIANAMIDSVNSKYGTRIPRVP